MACFSPLSAWQLETGDVVFVERGRILRSLTLPCGQCIGCRLERSRQWAVRCVHESQMHDFNVFVTLTYDDDHVPHDFSLRYSDYQKFMKRLRKRAPGVRFYMCGEYGETTNRPHYHACLFNCFFPDRKIIRKLPSGSFLYESAMLSELWPFGYSSIGDVTFESAAYVARYVMKKVTGPRAAEHYEVCDSVTGEIYARVPEFTHMSLKPGIGADWYRRYRADVYPHDRVVVRGVLMKPPRYYDNMLKAAPDMMSDEIEYFRQMKAAELLENSTAERLAVRRVVTEARLKSLVRGL